MLIPQRAYRRVRKIFFVTHETLYGFGFAHNFLCLQRNKRRSPKGARRH
jgi:hypothetical protein